MILMNMLKEPITVMPMHPAFAALNASATTDTLETALVALMLNSVIPISTIATPRHHAAMAWVTSRAPAIPVLTVMAPIVMMLTNVLSELTTAA